jgi:hypothetical protein
MADFQMLIAHKQLGFTRWVLALCKAIKIHYKIEWSYAPFGEEMYKNL